MITYKEALKFYNWAKSDKDTEKMIFWVDYIKTIYKKDI